MSFSLHLGNLVAYILADATQYTKTLRNAEKMMAVSSRKMTALGKKMSMRVTMPLMLIGGASVKAFGDFDNAMTESLAIMSNVSPEMRKEMEETAKEIAGRSVTSATTLARSYYYLASAGLDVAQSIGALPVVERFAVAGAFDMAQATTLLADAQAALGLKVQDAGKNMENMTRIGDVLTRANTLANASVEQFSTALTSKAGTAMKSYNIALEEGVAVLAAYADQGIKAEYAGNMFDRMLRLLLKAINSNAEGFKRLGIRTTDAQGNLVPLADIIEDMTKVMGDMGAAQKVATLQMLGFQARSQQSIMPLLKTAEKIRMFHEELKKAGGMTEEVANNQLKGFTNQMKILWNNVVLAAMELGEVLAPWVLRVGGYVRGLTQRFRGLDSTTKKWIAGIGIAVAAMGPFLIVLGLTAGLISKIIALLTTLGLVGMKWIAVSFLMATAVWAVADAFTETNLGFLSLVNSIRVGGTKIGTWMDVLSTQIWQAWDWTMSAIHKGWEALKFSILEVGAKIYRGMLTVLKPLAKAWDWLKGTNVAASFEAAWDQSLSKSEDRWETYYKNVEGLNKKYAQKASVWETVRMEAFQKDYKEVWEKEAARDKRKEMIQNELNNLNDILETGSAKAAETGLSQGEFKQVSLRHYSLASIGSTARAPKQKVADDVVAHKLDEVIHALKSDAIPILGRG